MPEITASTPAAGRRVWAVTELNREVRGLLEVGLGLIWVEGELSNLSRPASGHWYFTLKDAGAQVRCAMFRGRNGRVSFQPADGQQVLVRARVSLYEPRGDYQLIAEQMAPAGDGALQQAFELLKRRLDAEGLFATAAKRPLPAAARRIAVISSPSGAAIRDVLKVLQRRYPLGRVRLYPVPVQGRAAAPAVVAALARAGADAWAEVLLLVRGGGSLEDLQAFNEEAVARAIRACPIPVVTGIGHEIDLTIADYAADLRAPTPSAAAEQASPDQAVWAQRLGQHGQRLERAWQQRLRQGAERLDGLRRRLQRQRPDQRLTQRAQRLDELEVRLQRAWGQGLRTRRLPLQGLARRLQGQDPGLRLVAAGQRQVQLWQRLARAFQQGLRWRDQRLVAAMHNLGLVSPLATLQRGYAIVQRPNGDLLRTVHGVAEGDALLARLADGRLQLHVQAVVPEDDQVGDAGP